MKTALKTKVHGLKSIPPSYYAIQSGSKSFDIRKDDREFAVGHVLRLCEFADGRFTGKSDFYRVIYLTDFEQKPGYVVMGLRKMTVRGLAALKSAGVPIPHPVNSVEGPTYENW